MPLPILALIEPISKLLDKLIPDPQERDRIKLELQKDENSSYLQELQALIQADQSQAAVNQVEAQSDSAFKSDWRPAVAWLCIASLAYQVVFVPIVSFVMENTGHHVVFPAVDTGIISQLLFGLLGVMGGFHTYERVKMAS